MLIAQLVPLLEWRWVLLVTSICITLIHLWEEIDGRLWENYYWSPLVWVLNVLVLPAVLGVATAMGYVGCSNEWIMILLGIKVGDSVITHWLNPSNPGFVTSFLGIGEAILVILLLDRIHGIDWALIGFYPFVMLDWIRRY